MQVQIFKVQITLLLTILTTSVCNSQTSNEWSAFYPEAYARRVAITKVMPVYPQDAVQRGTVGVVQVKIAVDDRGEVVKMKLHPSIDASIKKSIADAVAKWTFKFLPEVVVLGRNILSRLTFTFSIKDGQPLVELYYPLPGAKDEEHLGYWDGYKELRDWAKWEEVQPTKNQKLD